MATEVRVPRIGEYVEFTSASGERSWAEVIYKKTAEIVDLSTADGVVVEIKRSVQDRPSTWRFVGEYEL